MGEKRDSLAEYIGISAPEVPKYLLANNFLTKFFDYDRNTDRELKYEDFGGILVCEEGSKEKEDKIKESFQHFFDCFSGRNILNVSQNRSKKIFYFPIVEQMLRTGSHNLRQVLFAMMDLDDTEYKELQNLLRNFLFQQRSGTNQLLSQMCQAVGNVQLAQANSGLNESFSYLPQKRFKELGRKLLADLKVLLSHSSFMELDFYKRYDYLSTLLTFYVIQFIVYRWNEKSPFILCKGSDKNSSLMSGEIHKACIRNYSDIRDVFPKLQKQYYGEKAKSEQGEEVVLKYQAGKVSVNDTPFFTYINDLFDGRFGETIQSMELVRSCFQIDADHPIQEYSKEEFVYRYFNFVKRKKGSNVVKISSSLPTSGRECGFVFPKSNTRFKYFALSQELLEFFVRLYLAEIDEEYDYLDNFVSHLETKYHIYIVKSNRIDKHLSNYQMKITASEFRKNEEALIENLTESNCVIKLSDSGYVITLPEKRGECKLL